MIQRSVVCAALLLSGWASAIEVTVQNDSLANATTGAIQLGFIAGEEGAAWLDAPCDGNIVAVQVFWRSATGTSGESIHESITISEAGTFPIPGTQLEQILGPVMNDGVINEFRFLDENSVIPLIVPVTQDETYVVSFKFFEDPISASLVTDADGCQAGRNSIFAIPGAPFDPLWISSCALGVSGDFVIRMVVDCPANVDEVDVQVVKTSPDGVYTPGQNVNYDIVVSNAGPNAANAVTLIDFFPGALSGITWTCQSTAGAATCPNASGSGNLIESINLPVGGELTYQATALVSMATTGVLVNQATAVVPNGLMDVNASNNVSSAELLAFDDLIFASYFDD